MEFQKIRHFSGSFIIVLALLFFSQCRSKSLIPSTKDKVLENKAPIKTAAKSTCEIKFYADTSIYNSLVPKRLSWEFRHEVLPCGLELIQKGDIKAEMMLVKMFEKRTLANIDNNNDSYAIPTFEIVPEFTSASAQKITNLLMSWNYCTELDEGYSIHYGLNCIRSIFLKQVGQNTQKEISLKIEELILKAESNGYYNGSYCKGEQYIYDEIYPFILKGLKNGSIHFTDKTHD